MTDDVPNQRPHGFLLILVGWALFVGSYIVSETSRWTDKARGFESGVFHVIPYSFIFAVMFLPVMCLVLLLVRRRQIRPLWRTLLVTSPVLVAGFLMIGNAIIFPLDSKSRFADMMDHELPTVVTDFRAYHSGGGFVDYLDMYYFIASSNEVQQLLESRPYELQHGYMIGPLPVGGLMTPPEWPKPDTWNGLRVYELNKGTWFYYIMTDEEQAQVFVIAGSI